MANIFPFKATFYRPDQTQEISSWIAPLFDVVNQKDIVALYQKPYNSLKLTVPSQSLTPRDMGAMVHQWRAEGKLQTWNNACFYAMFQHYEDPITKTRRCRKGFVAEIEVGNWVEGAVRRHEKTLPHSMQERLEVLEKTQLSTSPTHGLFANDDQKLYQILETAMRQPLYSYTDPTGVVHELAPIAEQHNPFLEELLSKKAIILADGHHRYSASIAFREKFPDRYLHRHLMYLTPLDEDNIKIYPTHRIIMHLDGFSPAFAQQLLKDRGTQIARKASAILAHFKREETAAIAIFPDIIIGLDTAELIKDKPKDEPVSLSEWLHELFLEKQMGIAFDKQINSGQIEFQNQAENVLQAVFSGQAQAGFLLKPLNNQEVKKAGEIGKTFPPKTTYFFPKTLTGLIMSQIHKKQ